MVEPSADQVRASRTKLLALIFIAATPIALSVLLFQYFPQWQPEGTTNNGELILPPAQAGEISEDLLSHEGWVLIQPVANDCDENCQQMLYLSRQVVIGLGKDAGRVERVLITRAEINEDFQQHLAGEHADISVLGADMSVLKAVSSQSPLLFLMDPNGNIMMYFSLEQAGKPMLKDLKHLLKLSNIG